VKLFEQDGELYVLAIPTVDGRWLILPRYTQPEGAARLVLDKLKLALPAQPPSRV